MHRFVSLVFGWMVLTLSSAELLAAAPAAPELTIETSGISITASWPAVPGADRYRIVYAPYPMEEETQVGRIDLGNQTSLTAELWDGASFLVAVAAYSGSEVSELSNIEVFTLSSGGSADWARGLWMGELRYCYSGNCQNQPTVIEFLDDDIWVGATTMDAFGKRYLYEMVGNYSTSGESVTGIGNSKLSDKESWDSSQNIKFNLKLSSSGSLSGDWSDGTGGGMSIKAQDFVRQ